MALTTLDWVLLALTLVVPIAVGIAQGRRAGSNLSQFFLSGRSLPWWLAGTSMVATTFAADTPLAVTGIVAASGVAGNWLWWNAALGSMLTVTFFARLWRRAGILTDVEFVELRYTGRAARALRVVRALYLGLPVNCLIIGWVNLALAKVLSVSLGWNRLTGVLVGLAATGGYAALAGLRGVVAADLVQFAIALLGAVVLAWYALSAPGVGGVAGLQAALPESTFRLWPAVGSSGAPAADVATTLALPVVAFVAYLGAQWWASWYPGQEPGGGGYVAQRMMSARSERDAVLATLWFHGGALLPAAVAVGAGGARRARALSGSRRPGSGLRPGVARPSAPWTTVCWIVATLATPAEPMAHLIRFYRRTRPGGPGWSRVASAAGE